MKNGNGRGTILAGTGIGKSRIGVLLSKTLIEDGTVSSIYIVVPTTNLIGG